MGFTLQIEQLAGHNNLPMELLLLADPSSNLVQQYCRRGHVFIARLDGVSTPVGVYVLLPHDEREQQVEIKNIAVASAYQAKGLGRKLLQHAVQTAQKMGFRQISIGTANSSLGQLALYQKSGFEISHINKDFFTTNYSHTIVENGIQARHMLVLVRHLR